MAFEYKENAMDEIVSLCKRKGFIFQAGDIYGGMNGFFDYGPLGVELKRNIKLSWWKDMVTCRENVHGIDCSIITHPRVWEASGHVAGFSDPMVDCKESKMRFRADQLFFSPVVVNGETIGYVSVLEDATMHEQAEKMASEMKRKMAKQGELAKIELKSYLDAKPEEYDLIPSPATGKPGSLTAPRDFNLMFETHVGALRNESSVAYLRPETAQGMFINFKNVVDTSRVKLPFGLAQVGRSFRNEITPRNFIFRSREFEQMEMEFFIDDADESWRKWHEYWINARFEWHKSIGLREELLGFDVHAKEKLAHYSKACTDITFHYPFGVQELEGIAARGCFDLTQHQTFSGKSMEFFDEDSKRKFIPHVIEPAVGVDRTFLAVMCAAYDQDEADGEIRTVLRFVPKVAPIKAAVFPLLKNKPELVEMATKLYKKLQRRWNVFYDETGAIGRRYRRMDEVGTPYCITVDFDSIENGTFTLRDRDSMKQERMSESEILQFLDEKING